MFSTECYGEKNLKHFVPNIPLKQVLKDATCITFTAVIEPRPHNSECFKHACFLLCSQPLNHCKQSY